MERHPSINLWRVIMYRDINERIYLFQIHLRNRHWHRPAFISHISVRMHTKLKSRHHTGKITNLLVIGLFGDMRPRMGLSLYT